LQEARLSIASSIDPNKCSVCQGTGVLQLQECIACKGSGLPCQSNLFTKPRKWFKSIGTLFKKEKKIVVVRGIQEQTIEEPRNAVPRSSLDPGAQSEWARSIQTPRTRQEFTCKTPKMGILIQDIENSSDFDFTDIVCRYAYSDVD
jgi:hypothetical protein